MKKEAIEESGGVTFPVKHTELLSEWTSTQNWGKQSALVFDLEAHLACTQRQAPGRQIAHTETDAVTKQEVKGV